MVNQRRSRQRSEVGFFIRPDVEAVQDWSTSTSGFF
jgi:hypothetical protein